MRASAIKQVNATGDVTTDDTYLRGVNLTAGADAASVTVRAGGSGGTVIETVKAAAGTTVEVTLYDAYCGGGVHATFTGTSPVATFIWS